MRSFTFQDSVPKNRCRGKDPSTKTPLWTFLTVFFLTMFLNLGVQGQTLYETCTGCTSEDIKATDVYLDPGPGAGCLNPNEVINGTLYVNLDVTSKTRYGLYLEFDLYINGQKWGDRWNVCYAADLPQGVYPIPLGPVNGVPAGSVIEIRNVWTGWENQDPDVGGGDGTYFCEKVTNGQALLCTDVDKPRCKSYPSIGGGEVTAKPVVNVTGPTAACVGEEGAFFTITGTASTTGINMQLTYSINGGTPVVVNNFDGEVTVPAASPFTVSQTLTAFITRIKSGETNCVGEDDAHTITANPPATVEAGGPNQACQSANPVAIPLAGASVGGGASTGAWSIKSGQGTLSSTAQTASPATVTFTPTAGWYGDVVLTLTTDNPEGPCEAVSDDRVIVIYPAATVEAGGPNTVCESPTPSAIPLSGSSKGGGAATAAWSITAGQGTLSTTAQVADPSTVTFTPQANWSGTVTLTLTTNNPDGPCDAVTDTRTINVNPAATVEAGGPNTVCESANPSAIPLSGATRGGGSATAAWSITSGQGTLSTTAQVADPSTVTFTPQANWSGTVTLTLTTNNPDGPCDAVSDTRTINVNPAATVEAGGPNTVCQSANPSAIPLSGATRGGGSATAAWSITSGQGTLSTTAQVADPSTVTFTPQANWTGVVTLTLTTNNPDGPCDAVSDTRTITVSEVATANAGTDQNVCAPAFVQLGASSGGAASSGSWSGGAGTFDDATKPDAKYTPSMGEKLNAPYTKVTLTWTTNDPEGPCTAASDNVDIYIYPIATVEAGGPNDVCQSNSPMAITLTGASFGGGATTAAWSITAGQGTLSSTAQTANPSAVTFTPQAGWYGNVTLTLTTNNPDGPCDGVSDTRTITVGQAATANAGMDQTVCADDVVTLDASFGGSATSGTWSGYGGTISSATDPKATYTPSNEEKMAGKATLTWTTNNPAGICDVAVDQVDIFINPIATVTARGTATTCVGVGVTLTAAIGGSATSVTWATVPAGQGTFTNANANGTSVTFTPTTTGAITVRATTNDPAGPCEAAYSDVVVTSNTCESGFCTYTQGGFGNEGGKDSYLKGGNCFKSTGATMTVGDALAGWGPGGMMISNMKFEKNPQDIALIIAYLPNGGPSKAYTGTKANLLTSGDKNTLLAQTITLGLNMGLNSTLASFELKSGYLITGSSDNCGETPDGMNQQCFKFSVSSGMDRNGDGKVTVGEVFETANMLLKGQSVSGVSLSSVAGAADAVNNAFDECRVPLRWSENCDVDGSRNTLADANTATFGTSANASSALGQNLMVKAYPNPFKDRVFISFTSPVSGKATVEIFDMTGRRLESINKGQVVAGRENTVEYTVPSTNRNSIIYRVTVDKFSVNGRLISPGINR